MAKRSPAPEQEPFVEKGVVKNKPRPLRAVPYMLNVGVVTTSHTNSHFHIWKRGVVSRSPAPSALT
mgnify:FL=1